MCVMCGEGGRLFLKRGRCKEDNRGGANTVNAFETFSENFVYAFLRAHLAVLKGFSDLLPRLHEGFPWHVLRG